MPVTIIFWLLPTHPFLLKGAPKPCRGCWVASSYTQEMEKQPRREMIPQACVGKQGKGQSEIKNMGGNWSIKKGWQERNSIELPSSLCKHCSTGNVYFMTTMTKSLDEKATFGLLFNLPFDSWYHFKDKHWCIVENHRSESQMTNVNVIPYLFLFFSSSYFSVSWYLSFFHFISVGDHGGREIYWNGRKEKIISQ